MELNMIQDGNLICLKNRRVRECERSRSCQSLSAPQNDAARLVSRIRLRIGAPDKQRGEKENMSIFVAFLFIPTLVFYIVE